MAAAGDGAGDPDLSMTLHRSLILKRVRLIWVSIDIGLYELVSFLSPPLKIGITRAIFKLSGYTPATKHLLNTFVIIGVIKIPHFLNYFFNNAELSPDSIFCLIEYN